MDTNKYLVLLTAVELGSLTEAAAALGYTQSGVSHMIKSLEDELGFALLRRSRAGVELTDEGATLLPEMRGLVRDAERLEQTAASLRGLSIGNVRLGIYSSISVHWMPAILEAFRRDYPGITVRMVESGPKHLTELIEENRVDFAFMSDQPGNPLKWIQMMDDPMFAVLPAGHYMAKEKACPISFFDRQPFIMSYEPDSSAVAPMGEVLMGSAVGDFKSVFEKAGIRLNVTYSSLDDNAVLSMVEHGLGVSILPGLVLQDNKYDVVTMPLNPPLYRRLGVGLSPTRDLSPAARQFLNCAKDVLDIH